MLLLPDILITQCISSPTRLYPFIPWTNSLHILDVMDALPDEILLKIFSNLRRDELERNICCVCKRWHEICQDPSLNVQIRREFSVRTDCDNDIYDSLVNEIVNGKLVRSIVLKHLWLFNANSFLEAVALSCPQLEVLQITTYSDTLSKETLDLVIEKCPNISDLTLMLFLPNSSQA